MWWAESGVRTGVRPGVRPRSEELLLDLSSCELDIHTLVLYSRQVPLGTGEGFEVFFFFFFQGGFPT